MVVYPCVAVVLTSLLCKTLSALPISEKLLLHNLRKRPQHVYASIAKEFIRVHSDFRYAGDSAVKHYLLIRACVHSRMIKSCLSLTSHVTNVPGQEHAGQT